MSLDDQPLSIVMNGQEISLGLAMQDQLIRSVVISLFTWRRARPDDDLPGNQRMGWWGDSYPTVPNDQIGSHIWLLSRSKLLANTPALAQGYAQEALQWMIDDGVAARVDVTAERYGMEGLAMVVVIYRADSQSPVSLRFSNVWEMLTHV